MSGTGLRDRGVVVTGAGGGIGRAAARRFASEGARVLIADLDAEGAAATEQRIRSEGGTATTVVGDLSERTVADEVVSTAVERFGGLDVLVNNAGIMDSFAAVADLTDAEWDRVLRVNLSAPFLLTRAALPHMLDKGRGVVVNTASEASLRGSAAGAAYTAAKHGVVGLTKSLAVTYRDSGIRANAIAPGGTATGITVDADPEGQGPTVLAGYGRNIGRVADADEQASAIVFLASSAAGNINGVVLPVDNGWSAV
ncbi:NAD(P)-dependent dehydrogenase, short-chain alcohol dehydrogenase family [Actinopolyspora xinjiangensis]|uniref:NAD(P)-dependent dehydrogenase, short-chain alcohol dehydrogenase family n=1 Tax=Actinopolyspora xinjiangensis TaxID=405564 RepID=A0A1H0WIQ5_9ACTN|nr:SDR family NAD(P)-dependent oxidoreductase [Actinopolyspora xinjiangensis]SDP90517.1 NAD(P)-dependent dehydrogenase, short-chain alcohol dehydrogenase family [Actinopolyspora xinjiangensis]